MVTKRYGWRKDKPDFRDQVMQLQSPGLFPPIVDLRPKCAPVLDQGQLGSCTANAIAASIDFEVKKRGLPLLNPSRLFIYYLERELEGSIDSDSGAEIRDGMKSVGHYGVAPESMWPYVIDKFADNPPSTCYQAATTHLVQRYYSVAQDLNQMKSCLAAGYPFVFGFTVYTSFEAESVANSGIVPMPSTKESVLGGHAVLAVGFNDSTQRFYVQNSWGTAWGQHGFFEIPYAYLLNPNLASDFWTIRLVEDIVTTVQETSEELIPVKTIKQEVDEIDSAVKGIASSIPVFNTEVLRQFKLLDNAETLHFLHLDDQARRQYAVIIAAIKAIVDLVNHNTALTQEILNLITDPQAVAFRINLQQGENMNPINPKHPHAAGIDFQFFENGQATASLTPVDASGNATTMPAGSTVPAWVSSDPGITVSPAADGLSALLTADGTPVTAATLTVTATLPDGTTTITGTSDPIDVVAQPPGSPVAFKIALS